MRNLIIALFFLSVNSSFGQNEIDKKELLVRVDCREKGNSYVKDIPQTLLLAFQQGKIAAYYPDDFTKQVSFGSFLNHFGLPVPDVPAGSATIEECGSDSDLQIDPYELKCMSMSFDIKEVQSFDSKRSRHQYSIKYIQIIYSHECSYNGLEYLGPVFKYADIANLDSRVQHPTNTAMSYSIKSLLDMRLFNATMIKKGNNDYYEKPAEADAAEKDKKVQKEVQMWEY